MHFSFSRYSQLEMALEGLKRSGVPLVQWTQERYGPAGFTDDKGLYYFIPKLASLSGLDLDRSIQLWSWTLLLVGTLVGGWFMFSLFREPLSRLVVVIGFFLLALLGLRISDIYLVQLFAVTLAVPWVLWMEHRPQMNGWVLGIGMAVVGLLTGYCNFLRAQSGTGVFLFAVFWVLLNRRMMSAEKFRVLIILTLFFFIPYLHVQEISRQRDVFLEKNVQGYVPVSNQHAFWHSFYIGLGYTKNNYGIQYLDECGQAKAKSIDPGAEYASPVYFEVLKKESIAIVRNDPFFFLENLAVKSMKVLFYFGLFGNLGFWFLYKSRPPWRVLMPFGIAALFYSLPGILVIPVPAYLLGMISVVAVFGIQMTGLGLEGYRSGRRLE